MVTHDLHYFHIPENFVLRSLQGSSCKTDSMGRSCDAKIETIDRVATEMVLKVVCNSAKQFKERFYD